MSGSWSVECSWSLDAKGLNLSLIRHSGQSLQSLDPRCESKYIVKKYKLHVPVRALCKRQRLPNDKEMWYRFDNGNSLDAGSPVLVAKQKVQGPQRRPDGQVYNRVGRGG